MVVVVAVIALLVAVALAAFLRARRPSRTPAAPRQRRILLPFTGGELNPRVLDAAIRISRAEEATLVPAYLLVVPLTLPLDAPLTDHVGVAMPLLEAAEHVALRAGIPVDARIEKGRSAIHALQLIWDAEEFHRVIAPAPTRQSRGFTPKDMSWILTHAPVETLVLRPAPAPAESSSTQAAPVRRLAAAIGRR
jgi:hypothetical protein